MLPLGFEIAIAIILGAALGSFSNVCRYRIARGISLMDKRSFCTSCGEKILWRDNIPVISYIRLRGKCRWCGSSISLSYPIVELIFIAFSLSMLYFYGPEIDFFRFLVLFFIVFTCGIIDLKYGIIPDKLTISGLVVGILSSPFSNSITFLQSITGALTGFGVLLCLDLLGRAAFKKEAVGGGDIKLAGAIGSFLGVYRTLAALGISFMIGGGFALILLTLRKLSKDDVIPAGQFFVGGILLTLYLL